MQVKINWVREGLLLMMQVMPSGLVIDFDIWQRSVVTDRSTPAIDYTRQHCC